MGDTEGRASIGAFIARLDDPNRQTRVDSRLSEVVRRRAGDAIADARRSTTAAVTAVLDAVADLAERHRFDDAYGLVLRNPDTTDTVFAAVVGTRNGDAHALVLDTTAGADADWMSDILTAALDLPDTRVVTIDAGERTVASSADWKTWRTRRFGDTNWWDTEGGSTIHDLVWNLVQLCGLAERADPDHLHQRATVGGAPTLSGPPKMPDHLWAHWKDLCGLDDDDRIYADYLHLQGWNAPRLATWTAVGIGISAAPSWAATRLAPAVAARWAAAGFEPDDGRAWAAAGAHPDDARHWVDTHPEIPADRYSTDDWAAAGIKTGRASGGWRRFGCTPSDARAWIDAGYDGPAAVRRAIARGITIPRSGRR